MTRQLRAGKGKTGLVLANGGWVTYQHAVCLSSSPRSDGLPYPDTPPLPKYVTDVQIPEIAEQAEGDASIEVRWQAKYTRQTELTGHLHRLIQLSTIVQTSPSEATSWEGSGAAGTAFWRIMLTKRR